MVYTIYCVHTILRYIDRLIKTGSPGAYNHRNSVAAQVANSTDSSAGQHKFQCRSPLRNSTSILMVLFVQTGAGNGSGTN